MRRKAVLRRVVILMDPTSSSPLATCVDQKVFDRKGHAIPHSKKRRQARLYLPEVPNFSIHEESDTTTQTLPDNIEDEERSDVRQLETPQRQKKSHAKARLIANPFSPTSQNQCTDPSELLIFPPKLQAWAMSNLDML